MHIIDPLYLIFFKCGKIIIIKIVNLAHYVIKKEGRVGCVGQTRLSHSGLDSDLILDND